MHHLSTLSNVHPLQYEQVGLSKPLMQPNVLVSELHRLHNAIHPELIARSL
jgi:hypothetical protein